MGDQGGSAGGRKEIYTYEAPWCIYAMGWCQRADPGDRYRLAVGSFTEEYNNKVQVMVMKELLVLLSSYQKKRQKRKKVSMVVVSRTLPPPSYRGKRLRICVYLFLSVLFADGAVRLL